MDRETLMMFRHLWGLEDDDKRCTNDLLNLSEPERGLYLDLKGNVFGENVRLEQERIAFGWLRQRLGAVMGVGAQASCLRERSRCLDRLEAYPPRDILRKTARQPY